ncbi:MAG: hypothetical protein Q3X95_06400, partial [Duodenibacillus sp.]|nr:hypothetical protein [Duodenibacillus sp.]
LIFELLKARFYHAHQEQEAIGIAAGVRLRRNRELLPPGLSLAKKTRQRQTKHIAKTSKTLGDLTCETTMHLRLPAWE